MVGTSVSCLWTVVVVILPGNAWVVARAQPHPSVGSPVICRVDSFLAASPHSKTDCQHVSSSRHPAGQGRLSPVTTGPLYFREGSIWVVVFRSYLHLPTHAALLLTLVVVKDTVLALLTFIPSSPYHFYSHRLLLQAVTIVRCLTQQP